MPRKISLVLCALLFISEIAQAKIRDQIQFHVEKYKLNNGLTVLVYEDHKMPLLSYQQWFRVGSSREKPGRTGLAHFFEHLMFKGTKKYPKGVFDQIIQKNGGSNNAFTTNDYTGYYTNLPSNKLELIIDIESDRMRNLNFEQSEIDSEREVVKEERRMRYENSVFGSLFEEIRHTLYKVSPYRWPVIGYMADLNATKIDELKDFYNKYYSPNNAVLVIAGDVKLANVKKLVEKYYGPIPSQKIPDFKPVPEPNQLSPRSSVLQKDVQSNTTAIVYPGVVTGNKDSYALDLLASALGGGSSSRLYKRLVYKNQLATQISMSSSNNKLAGEISVYVSFKPGANIQRGIALINDEFAKIKKQKISDEELLKLKNQVMLDYVKGLQTVDSKARAIAINEIYHDDYKQLFDDLDKYDAVTADDIQRVAKEYLTREHRNTIQIVPKMGATL